MKRFLLPLMALSIALTSCSRDNDDAINNPITNPVAQGNLLAEITEEGRILSQFIYDGDKIKSSSWADGALSYFYTGDQITAIHRDKGVYGTWDIRYTYNPNGTLHSAYEIHDFEHYGGVDNNNNVIMEKRKTITTREYTYVNNNTINVKETFDHYIVRENSDEKIDTGKNESTFTLNNGNIVSKIIKPQDRLSSTDTTIYTYDDKINPLSNIKGFSALAIDFNIIGLIHINGNKNNILSEKNSSVNFRGVERDSYQNINEYEYNSKGYPTKQTNVSSGPHRADFTTISHYKYK